MKKSNVIGIDLAKNVMQVCKVSKHGELLSNKAVSPRKLKELLAKATPSVVAMEGCGACHYWARLARSLGHEARIINPKKVKAFLQGQKTDYRGLMLQMCQLRTPEEAGSGGYHCNKCPFFGHSDLSISSTATALSAKAGGS